MTNQTTSDNSIINSLKRLERSGDERSKATQKLRDAAQELCVYLLKNLPSNFAISGAEYGDFLRIKDGAEIYVREMGTYYDYGPNGGMGRSKALGLARAIADGLLDTIADQLEQDTKAAQEAHETIQRKLIEAQIPDPSEEGINVGDYDEEDEDERLRD